jgi:hypothetical protein
VDVCAAGLNMLLLEGYGPTVPTLELRYPATMNHYP